jgi:hypothetical protein
MTASRRVIPASIIALTLLSLSLSLPSAAQADHFRGGYITWKLLGPPSAANTVRLRTVQVWDSDDVTPLEINPGVDDTTISSPAAVIYTANDGAGDSYTVIEYSVDYTYPNAGPWEAFLGVGTNDVVCCRFTDLVNVDDDGMRIATVVDLTSANTESGKPTFPMLIQMKADCPNSVPLTAVDPDGVTCALGADGDDPGEAGTADPPPFTPPGGIVPTSPGGAVLGLSGCALTWTPTGTTPGDRYATQVLLNEGVGTGQVAVDFIIEIVAGQCCGNGIQEGGEICDGADDAACGAGSCQSDCSCCGDGIANAGEQCDVGDDAICVGGSCNPSTCTCCGDGVANAGEICDGADDDACFPSPGFGCASICVCAVPGQSQCTDSCDDDISVCDGLEDELRVLGVGQSFATRFPLDAIFTGEDPCDDLIVNDLTWGELPLGATLTPPAGSTGTAPTTGTCSNDPLIACDSCTDCNDRCTHDTSVLCVSNDDCDAVFSGSQCTSSATCEIPDNSFPVTFDWTPGGADANQTHDVTVTFTPPGFTVPGGLEYFCSFEIRVPGCGDDIADGRCTHDPNVFCTSDTECAALSLGSTCFTDRRCSHDGSIACDADLDCSTLQIGSTCVQAEQCDGVDNATCGGQVCRPPGDPNECQCPVCGDDDVNHPNEECDGTDDAVCGGSPCLPAGDASECECAECGDGDVNQLTEDCDGGDDSLCPGLCLPPGSISECNCAGCGDGVVHVGIGEQCEPTSDAACPGLCLPPGDLNECSCPVCGDGDDNQPSEACDGTDDAACPGGCRVDCTCPDCGDGVTQPSEECDGASAAACPGLCRPPGDVNECSCPVCGDADVNQPGEACDGVDDAACPGACLPNCTCSVCGDGTAQSPAEECDGVDDSACPGTCRPPGDPNECQCPVCGDADVNQPSEACDGVDDSACPGNCLSSCICSVCGNDVAQAPVEDCDGVDDAACLGLCRPPGDLNECSCPVCGDDDVNEPGEECDGADDTACPGECADSCVCAECGDGTADTPIEECDGADAAACPGACFPSGNAFECLCPFCGDGAVNAAGEECEPPSAEICDNLGDDNSDQLIDCDDPLCSAVCEHDASVLCSVHATCRQLQMGSRCQGVPSCGTNCREVNACEVVSTDPSYIRFGNGDAPDLFRMHARFIPVSEVDALVDGFAIEITNSAGIIYRAELVGADFKVNGNGSRFRFRDAAAKTGNGSRGGIYKLTLLQRDGAYSWRLQAYADLSAATEARMTMHILIGDDGTSITADWGQVKNGWRLGPSDIN